MLITFEVTAHYHQNRMLNGSKGEGEIYLFAKNFQDRFFVSAQVNWQHLKSVSLKIFQFIVIHFKHLKVNSAERILRRGQGLVCLAKVSVGQEER